MQESGIFPHVLFLGHLGHLKNVHYIPAFQHLAWDCYWHKIGKKDGLKWIAWNCASWVPFYWEDLRGYKKFPVIETRELLLSIKKFIRQRHFANIAQWCISRKNRFIYMYQEAHQGVLGALPLANFLEGWKKCFFFNQHTIEVCIRCSWRCPGNSAANLPYLRMSLFPCFARSNVQVKVGLSAKKNPYGSD